MQAFPAGDAAVLVDLADSGSAAQLALAIRAARLPWVRDVVPGASTVLVSVEPGTWDTGELSERLISLPPGDGTETAPAAAVEIAVRYDGPDLADVAALTGLPVSEVVARHAAAQYRVGWLGFMPGFGYLTGLDPALSQVPRLDTPRVSVPAGSVAIAGGLAAVYPGTSPGGWRLLGRTDEKLWDPQRSPPALFAPGTPVRFRAVESLAGEAATVGSAAAGTAAAGRAPASGSAPGRIVEVLQPGPLATVQDLGRPGSGHLGVPHSGAADAGSMRLANALVGNEDGAAGLEVTLGRLGLRFDCDAVVGLAGAPASARLTSPGGARSEQPPGTAFSVTAGTVLRLGSPTSGLRSYLALDGGIDVAPVLGSRSADLLSGLGPPPLRAGDILPLAAPPPPAGAIQADMRIPPPSDATVELQVVAGPRDDWFGPAALAALTGGSYQVAAASNRTGLRLEGPRLDRRGMAELPSEGMATGSIQVAHDGQPILLLADHPTTGGYPVIAVVRSADVDAAAQLRPGQNVTFRLAAR